MDLSFIILIKMNIRNTIQYFFIITNLAYTFSIYETPLYFKIERDFFSKKQIRTRIQRVNYHLGLVSLKFITRLTATKYRSCIPDMKDLSTYSSLLLTTPFTRVRFSQEIHYILYLTFIIKN